MNPVKIYRSGLVRRWHQNPEMSQFGQTNAAHQWGCAMLLLILRPAASAGLIMHVLTHDVGELDAGDLSNPKKNENPELAKMLGAFEEKSRRETLGPLCVVGTDERDEWLWLVDKLEAVLFMMTFNRRLIDGDGWPEHIAAVRVRAKKLGCLETVDKLMREIYGDD